MPEQVKDAPPIPEEQVVFDLEDRNDALACVESLKHALHTARAEVASLEARVREAETKRTYAELEAQRIGFDQGWNEAIEASAKAASRQTYSGDFYSLSTDAHDGGVRSAVAAIREIAKPTLSATTRPEPVGDERTPEGGKASV